MKRQCSIHSSPSSDLISLYSIFKNLSLSLLVKKMSRAFGPTIQPNGQRKALACISQNPANINKQNVLKPNNQYGLNIQSLKSQPFITFQKSVSTSNLVDQENDYLKPQNVQQQQQTFKIYKDVQDTPVEQKQQQQPGKNQEELLQENIEAVKKELNNFLIDSLEKSLGTDDQKICDQSFKSLSDKENDPKNDVCPGNDDDTDMIIDDYDDLENQKENFQSHLSIHSDISYVQHYPELDLLGDYSSNIWYYMLEKERKFMPNPFYMSNQQNINTKMRSILVDWLVDVADEYKLKDETLFLAINYIDRFGLAFDVSVPTSNYFLEMFSTKLVLDKQIYCLAKYLNLLTMLECTPFLKYYPSEIAICSIMLAGKILRISDIIPEDFLQQSILYEKQLGNQGDVSQLLDERNNLLEALNQLRLYANKHPQQAIQKKYCENKFYNVSKLADEANI
ncbi:hypothetical protein DERP_012306 [Dermatophagoides pteronyssinus]|uniref:Cyclin C-terminal domain-containing protein n=1 Tax=Dermatophagoides pteronyssinus TaxID=6956 RepID=A0ABQ8JQC4_DERPT|nr:hypothetical protein DERP_012306 [Dermatophagoides pteronyssinus]